MRPRPLIAALTLVGIAVPLSAQTVKSGIAAWQRSDYAGAVRIWRPLAEKGDADAQFNLAQAYRLGRGVPTNLAAAQTWLQRSATQGHVDAQTTLGLLLFQGGNRAAGIRWLKSAANKNDPRAMLVYGTALFNGDGVPQNPSLGYSYVSRAAAQGLAPAKATLAQMEDALPPSIRKKAASAATKTKATAAKERPAKPQAAAPSASPASPSGSWRVQLGAFSQRSTAEALFRKLSGSGVLAGRSASYVPAGSVVRLQVGPYPSKGAATDACRAIAARGQACFPVSAK